MKRFFRVLFMLCLAEILFVGGLKGKYPSFAPEKIRKEEPRRDLTVGCLYSGESDYYLEELLAFGEELGRQRLLSGFSREWDWYGMEEVWEDFSHCISTCLRFLPERFYDCSQMTDATKNRILFAKDVDLWLAFGDAAEDFLVENDEKLSADALTFSCEDPSRGGSELEHTYVLLYEEGTDRQIDAAWKILHFSSVGVVVDSNERKTPAWMKSLMTKATTCCFTIHKVRASDMTDPGCVKEAFEKISGGVDLLLITEENVTAEMIPEGVETLSLVSEDQVKDGVLMYVSTRDANEEGVFAAHILKLYLDGTGVKELPREFQITPSIYLNRDAAAKANIQIPFDTWLMAYKVYGGA